MPRLRLNVACAAVSGPQAVGTNVAAAFLSANLQISGYSTYQRASAACIVCQAWKSTQLKGVCHLPRSFQSRRGVFVVEVFTETENAFQSTPSCLKSGVVQVVTVHEIAFNSTSQLFQRTTDTFCSVFFGLFLSHTPPPSEPRLHNCRSHPMFVSVIFPWQGSVMDKPGFCLFTPLVTY